MTVDATPDGGSSSWTPIVEHCIARRLNPDERLRLFLNLCEAVDALHQNFTGHGDIGPQTVAVSDSGAIRLLPSGAAPPASSSADIAALQSLLLEILSGGASTTGRVPGDAAAIAAAAPSVYRSAGQLAADIRNSLAGRPVSVRMDSAVYRVRKLLARNKTVIAGGAALTLSTLLLGWGYFTSERSRYRAEEELREIRAVTGLMSMSIPGRILEVPGSLALRRKMVGYGLAYVDQQSTELDPADLRRRKRIALGYFHIANSLGEPGGAAGGNLADFDGAARAYRRAIDLLVEDDAPLRRDKDAAQALSLALMRRPQALLLLQRAAEAQPAAEECIALATSRLRDDNTELSCRASRLRAASELGKPVQDSEVEDLVSRGATGWTDPATAAQFQAETRRVAARYFLQKKDFAKALEHAIAGLDITAKKDRATPMSLQRGDLLTIAARAERGMGVEVERSATRFDECFDVLRELMRRDAESVEARIALALALVESVDFIEEESVRQARLRESEQLARGVLKDAAFPQAEAVLTRIRAVPSRIP